MTSKQDTPAGSLHVVGTPIGNLGDLSLRAREVLGAVDVIAAEDTRRTRRLLSSIGLKGTIIAFHDHNEVERTPGLLARLLDGESIALVSDAGTPLISDPGWRLVRAALAEGIEVVSVPGPSAVSAALSVCGLPTDRFVFEGFLPRRKAQRTARLQALHDETRTMVFFESVHRLDATLRVLAEHFGAQRDAAIARELTKLHECVYAGSLAELGFRLGDGIPLRGEFVVVVAGDKVAQRPEESEALRIFSVLCEELPPDKAATLCARITGLPRNVVYRLTRRKP